jgi:hypothetical protein
MLRINDEIQTAWSIRLRPDRFNTWQLDDDDDLLLFVSYSDILLNALSFPSK